MAGRFNSSAILVLALAVVLPSVALAEAAAKIPSSEMPGRESDRFIDKFPQRADPAIAAPSKAQRAAKRTCRVKGTKRRRAC
jgi:hypothetical protein